MAFYKMDFGGDPYYWDTDHENDFRKVVLAGLVQGLSDEDLEDAVAYYNAMPTDRLMKHRDTAGGFSTVDALPEGAVVENVTLRDNWTRDPRLWDIVELVDPVHFDKKYSDDMSPEDKAAFSDDLDDFIIANYGGSVPEADYSDKVWDDFYKDGSSFRKFEDRIYNEVYGKPYNEVHAALSVDANGDGDEDITAVDADDDGSTDIITEDTDDNKEHKAAKQAESKLEKDITPEEMKLFHNAIGGSGDFVPETPEEEALLKEAAAGTLLGSTQKNILDTLCNLR